MARKALLEMATSGKRPTATIYYMNRQAARRARLMPATGLVVIPDFVVEREKEAA